MKAGNSFEKTGDWKKVKALIKNMKAAALEGCKVAILKGGLAGERFAVKAIQNQSLNWKPLSEEYLERKVKEGYSNKIYVMSSTLFQAITSWPGVTKKGQFKVNVGVKRNVMSKDGKTELANIAAVLEFGSKTGGVPARPLWRPTVEEMKTFMKGGIVRFEVLKRLQGFIGGGGAGVNSKGPVKPSGPGPLRKDGVRPDKRFKANR